MATLKISDLSVGDWVRTKDGNVTVDIISPLEVVVMNDYGNLCACKIEDIEPIPITAEILEKNGFEFEKASRWHICELEDKTRINVWIGRNNEGRIEVSKPDHFEDEYYFKYADIEVLNIAVHQLQHALRLAGLDKEINL